MYVNSKSIYIPLMIGAIVWLAAVAPARAEYCRQVAGRDVCIVKIARSAKNYWQYNAIVSVDEVNRSLATYNCRDRYILNADGTTISFDRDPSSAIVCRLYRR